MKALKTIKQIADELGIDKQKVYRFIKQNHITDVHHEVHQNKDVKYFDDVAETLIKQHFQSKSTSNDVHHEVHQNHIKSTSNEAIIEVLLKQSEALQKELDQKNKQINDLSEALRASQLLQARAEQNLIEYKEQKKTIFRWFRKEN